MKQYALTANENQLRVLINALDFYSRIGMGQLEELVHTAKFNNVFPKEGSIDVELVAERIVKALKPLLGFPADGHFSITNKNVIDDYRIAWDIQKVVRHQLWLDNTDRNEAVVDAAEPTPSVPTQPLAQIHLLRDEPPIKTAKPPRRKKAGPKTEESCE